MRILIAPNAFKHSLSGEEAALAIEAGLLSGRLTCSCERFPVGDGGDGTGDLIVNRFRGNYVECDVADPLGKNIRARYGIIQGGNTAVIEMANASGLRLLAREDLNPLRATSYGTGQQIKNALDRGVKKIIIALGGSATVDGACGILQALGIRFLDGSGNELTGLPESLVSLATINVSALDARIAATELVVLCDVDNKLYGPQGSAAVFGPQKGASAADVNILDGALRNFAAVIKRQLNVDVSGLTYGGTAGGAAAGLHALLGATLVNGIDHYLDITNFDGSLKKADIVITGEGSIDEQTLQGKAPYGVAKRAKAAGIPVIALAGRVPLLPGESLLRWFDVLQAIGNEPVNLSTALEQTAANLARTARAVGDMLSLGTVCDTLPPADEG